MGADALPGAQHPAWLVLGCIRVPSIWGHHGDMLLLAGMCSSVVCSHGSEGETMLQGCHQSQGHVPPRSDLLARAVSGAMGGRGELPEWRQAAASMAGKCWELSWVLDGGPLLGLLDADRGFVLLAQSLKFQGGISSHLLLSTSAGPGAVEWPMQMLPIGALNLKS